MLSRRAYSVCLVTLILTALLLSGCFGSKEPVPVDPEAVKNGLIGKVWKCESLFERDVVGDTPLTIEFLPDGKVKGSGGCNNFSGEYSLAGESLSFGPLMSTKKSCGPATDEQEFTYLSFLARIKRVKVDEDELELFSDGNPTPMLFTTGGGGGLFW